MIWPAVQGPSLQYTQLSPCQIVILCGQENISVVNKKNFSESQNGMVLSSYGCLCQQTAEGKPTKKYSKCKLFPQEGEGVSVDIFQIQLLINYIFRLSYLICWAPWGGGRRGGDEERRRKKGKERSGGERHCVERD